MIVGEFVVRHLERITQWTHIGSVGRGFVADPIRLRPNFGSDRSMFAAARPR